MTRPLHTIEPAKALQDRWSEGIGRYRRGDGSQPFVGDPVTEAYEEALDFTLYVREAQRQRAMPSALARELERHARVSIQILRRFLVARDSGGVVPLDHPAARYGSE